MSPRIKICGVTCVEDARMCAELGVDAIGLNFVRQSPRFCTPDAARNVIAAMKGRLMLVCVVADATVEEMVRLRDDFGFDCLQLHGEEPPEVLAPLLPHAYKALRVGSARDVARADAYGGEHVLVDGRVDGVLGGTGHAFDWTLVRELSERRSVTLAGGLHAGNVQDAIRAVRPFCVDVASGVELPKRPGRKDEARLRAFVSAVRGL